MLFRRWWLGVVLTLLVTSVRGQQPPDLTALAREAYVFAFPALESYRTMSEALLTEQARQSGGAFNRFKLFPLADSESRWIVRPNNDTLYSSAWLDLRSGPVVVTVPSAPDGRYRSLQLIDLFTHNFGIVGGGDRLGGRYLVVGPTWDGRRPAGVDAVYRSESSIAQALARTAVYGSADLATARALQLQFTIEAIGGTTRAALDTLPVFDVSWLSSGRFIECLNEVFALMPVHQDDVALVARLRSLGVRYQMGTPTVVPSLDQQAAIENGVRAARKDIEGARAATGKPRGFWSVADAFGDRSRMRGRNIVRAAAAMHGLFGLDQEEAVYYSARVDAAGRPLASGEYRLSLKMEDLPPAAAFWSITVYDGDGYLVKNKAGRYSIGDRTEGLRRDSDGGVTLYLQPSPPGQEGLANWLPIPEGPFGAVLRLYRPDKTRLDTYVPPPIRRVQ